MVFEHVYERYRPAACFVGRPSPEAAMPGPTRGRGSFDDAGWSARSRRRLDSRASRHHETRIGVDAQCLEAPKMRSRLDSSAWRHRETRFEVVARCLEAPKMRHRLDSSAWRQHEANIGADAECRKAPKMRRLFDRQCLEALRNEARCGCAAPGGTEIETSSGGCQPMAIHPRANWEPRNQASGALGGDDHASQLPPPRLS